MAGGASAKLKNAAKKIFVQTCASFCQIPSSTTTISCSSPNYSPPENLKISVPSCTSDVQRQEMSTNKTLCAICLEPLNYKSGSSPGQAIFTAQCAHAFHFGCISSNVRHGSVTCPICRAHWTQLPRNLNLRRTAKPDPILQILDESIAHSRVHRQSFLRSTRYDDDDPIEPARSTDQPRLHLSLLTDQGENPILGVKLAHQPATDLVLVASPTGPNLRLMKQAMALVVFSLRPIDRLAIVNHVSAAARVFPLRRMTSCGKRSALQVIDRLFHSGRADPIEGLNKGVKILCDRLHTNAQSSILHLSDSPSRSFHHFDTEVPVAVHQFHVSASNGREFEEFLARTLGGAIRDVQMRIGEGRRVIRIEELRGGEERSIPICTQEHGHLYVEYSYREGGNGGCIETGEVVLGLGDKGESSENGDGDGDGVCGRMSNETWDFHDPFMARRWAKHLHGYRL